MRLMPDMIPYTVGTKAAYTAKSFNGRNPHDDSMDAVLSIFVGKDVTDTANLFDRHPDSFPYVEPIE